MASAAAEGVMPQLHSLHFLFQWVEWIILEMMKFAKFLFMNLFFFIT